MLYYSPQIWASDDTDAVERMGIQYGTSYIYPLSSIGSHVSIVPNHQTNRVTALNTRTNVALFGTFGYELDLAKLTDAEFEEVKRNVAFCKQYREVIHTGTFYRLASPFVATSHHVNKMAWMVVSQDKRTAIVGDYALLEHPMSPFSRLHLQGLDPQMQYDIQVIGGSSSINGASLCGDELMYVGMIDSDASTGSSSGEVEDSNDLGVSHDFDSRLFVLNAR
jgi:alpha-galactosidase